MSVLKAFPDRRGVLDIAGAGGKEHVLSAPGSRKSEGPHEQAAAALEALHKTGTGWSALPVRERLKALGRLETILAREADSVVLTLAHEIGRPITEGYAAEVIPTLAALRWLRRHASTSLLPKKCGGPFGRRRVDQVPYGVIGLVSPWNYPVYLTLTTIAWALAAGNVVLWKPSEHARVSSSLMMELLEEAGLGQQVRALFGGPEYGAAVADLPCDKTVFIGSLRAGRQVLARVGRAGRPAVVELSGVDPMLVLADADISAAARSAVWARSLAAGQTCMAPRRVYVHASRQAEFLRAAEAYLRSLRAGDPTCAGTEVGPLRSAADLSCALHAVEDAVRRGARVICGGRAGSGSMPLLEPTLLTDCPDGCRLFREDIPGPILAVASFQNLEEVIVRVHKLPQMLTASVWSRDPQQGQLAAARISAGVVSVNDVILPAAQADTAFGGIGSSGYGRLRGAEGLREMVWTRTVFSAPPPWRPDWHLFPHREGTAEVLRGSIRLLYSTGTERGQALREWMKAVGGLGKANRK
ncbi:MAG: aldehyde dehydrogenase family protein [Armatimonadetes bacterium]|nr:aldehyde dehydrogenase family protein [Armatimonadota bacterium]